MKYIYMLVGTVVGGLLGWGLGLYVFSPYLMEGATNGFFGLIGCIIVIGAGILIGAIWFGLLGYWLGTRLQERVYQEDYVTDDE